MPFTTRYFGLSDQGKVRENNEDVWEALPELNFYVLADGIGGHRAGEIASRAAVDFLIDFAKTKLVEPNQSPSKIQERLETALIRCNRFVWQMGQKSNSYSGMGTTICCLLGYAGEIFYASVGDSRIYRYADDELEQLSVDNITWTPLKRMLTKAIGIQAELTPHIDHFTPHTGDLYLLCSDGLSDFVSEEEIAAVLAQKAPLEQLGTTLVARANAAGGQDNITLILIRVEA